MSPDDLPAAPTGRSSIWYNSIFLLAAFGLLGGILAWAGGAVDAPEARSRPAGRSGHDLHSGNSPAERTSPNGYGLTPQQADDAIHDILVASGNNPYLAIELDTSLSPDRKRERLEEIARLDHRKDLITHIIGFGLCGLFISVCLSIAEPVIDHNLYAAVKNGSIGAALGLLGGLAASLVVDRIYRTIGGAEHGLLRQALAQSISWGVLGCFVAIAPGVVAQKSKRFLIGLAGGTLGGIVGGVLLDPLSRLTASPELGRLAAFGSIGLLTGAATGVIERAAAPAGSKSPRASSAENNSFFTAIPPTSAQHPIARFICSAIQRSADATPRFICSRGGSKSRTSPSAATRG